MVKYVIDDIDALLKLGKGDSAHLKRIKETFEKQKIISIADRTYVEKLTSKYIPREKEETSTDFDVPFAEKLAERKAEILQQEKQNLEKIQIEAVKKPEKIENIPEPQKIPQENKNSTEGLQQLTVKEKIPKKGGNIFNKKIIIRIAIALVAVVVVGGWVYVSQNSSFMEQISLPTSQEVVISNSPAGLSVTSDESSYKRADIISISGRIDTSDSGDVIVSIENANGKLIWSEKQNVKSKGGFSTLLIAGGAGWEQGGTYKIKAEQGTMKKEISFEFSP